MTTARQATDDERRRERLGLWEAGLRILFAAVAVAVAIWIVYEGITKTNPVAASFTRVGGTTRVETALAASRFWTAPKTAVVVEFDATTEGMLAAGLCAAHMRAPLLFRGATERQERRVRSQLEDWRKASKGFQPTDLTDEEALLCARDRGSLDADLSLFDARSDRPARPDGIHDARTLAPFLVIAAPRSKFAVPDIAIGTALGAHITERGRGVTLAIVPRDLELDPDAERRLRRQQELVEGGVVLGQTGILSDDNRGLLRQIISSPERQGLAKLTDTLIGPLGALVAAILALLAIQAAAPVTAAAGHDVLRRVDKATHSVGKEGAMMVPIIMRPELHHRIDEPSGGRPKARRSSWLADVEGRPVTVWLRSGGTVRGFAEHDRPTDAVWLMRPGAGTVVVPLENIALIEEIDEPDAATVSPVRHSGVRLVAELLAEMTDEPPPSLDRAGVTRSINRAKETFRTSEVRLSASGVEDLIGEAVSYADSELYAALRGLRDALRLADREPDKRGATVETLCDALKRVADVGLRPTSWTSGWPHRKEPPIG